MKVQWQVTMAESPRRFPSPWRADPMPGGYVVRDANGQALAFIYSRETEAEARQLHRVCSKLSLVIKDELAIAGPKPSPPKWPPRRVHPESGRIQTAS
jgi:hypothetical protein